MTSKTFFLGTKHFLDIQKTVKVDFVLSMNEWFLYEWPEE